MGREVIILSVTQYIPTMTKSHHGGNVSVMDMVGFCHGIFPPFIIIMMMIGRYVIRVWFDVKIIPDYMPKILSKSNVPTGYHQLQIVPIKEPIFFLQCHIFGSQ